MDIHIYCAYIFLKIPNTVNLIPLGIALPTGGAVGVMRLLLNQAATAGAAAPVRR